jgi:nicotinamidase/pyrazinamidase
MMEDSTMSKKVTIQPEDALLIVDVQNDFCPGGALPLDEGDEVVPVINQWIKRARKCGISVVASRDWHPGEHISFKDQGGLWPAHCVQDTEGARFHSKLQLPEDAIIVTKGVRFDQDQYSAFDQTGLGGFLKKMGIKRLLVTGLALDICVRASVLDARRADFEVVLITDATRAEDAGKIPETIEEMQLAGAEVINVEKLLYDDTHRGAAESAESAENDAAVCLKAPEFAEHYRLLDHDHPCADGRNGDPY